MSDEIKLKLDDESIERVRKALEERRSRDE